MDKLKAMGNAVMAQQDFRSESWDAGFRCGKAEGAEIVSEAGLRSAVAGLQQICRRHSDDFFYAGYLEGLVCEYGKRYGG